jgi:predicted Zn-dependent protease
MLSREEKEEIKKWYEIYHIKKGIRNRYSGETEREKWLKTHPFPHFNKIEMMYKDGHGYKYLSKETDLPYNFIRSKIIQSADVKERTGFSVVTDKLREKRKENASGKKSNWYDWPNKKPFMLEKNVKSFSAIENSVIFRKS